MTDTNVAYHVEDGVGRPAINVKDHNGGSAYWPFAFGERNDPRSGYDLQPERERYVDQAYDRIVSDFWQAAQEIATQKGLGEIEQQGRSGGWLVFTQGYDPSGGWEGTEGWSATDAKANMALSRDLVEERTAWLAGYRSMVEWADAWIADAPRKVAALAQQLAMDEAGEPAARRHFAFSFARGPMLGLGEDQWPA